MIAPSDSLSLACLRCGEPVIPAPKTTRLGYSHVGGSEHEVELGMSDLVALGLAPAPDVVVTARPFRARAAARLFGLPRPTPTKEHA